MGKENVIGNIYGRITVIADVDNRGKKRCVLCQCSCESKTTKVVRLDSLKSGRTVSCGCCQREWIIESRLGHGENYDGQIFGRLTVLNDTVRNNKRNQRQVVAQCSCNGNIKAYSLPDLKSGNTTSCGCTKREKATERKIKINNGNKIQNKPKREKIKIKSGDKFGRWTSINEADKRNGNRYYLCECSCHDKTRKEIQIYSLLKGESKSCGCISREEKFNSGKDYTGQIFGRLTVLYEVERASNGDRQVMARCSCDGNIKKYRLPSLKYGSTTSCSCYHKEMTSLAGRYQVEDYEKKHPLFCQVEQIRNNPNGLGIEVKCKNSDCRKWFIPTYSQIRNRLYAIERPELNSIGTEMNFYCSNGCKSSCALYNLKSDPFKNRINDSAPSQYELNIWSDKIFFRQLQEYGYNFCTKCHSTENLAAHHIDPKKLEPFFALDPENGIIFCRDCHFSDGHNGECSTGALAYKICK